MPLYINRKMWTPCFASKQKAAAEITAINVSKYDRIEGEKVWLYENNGSYTIVDALGLTSRAFTGVCKENIARNSSGTVEAVVDGELVVRWTRNFNTNGSGFVLDDAARTIKFASNSGNYYQAVWKEFSNPVVTPTTSVEIQLKAKFNGNGSSHNQANDFMVFGDTMGSYSTPNNHLLELVITKGIYYRVKTTIGSISSQEKTLLPLSAWVNDKWYWLKVTVTDSEIYGVFSEDGINWSAPVAISGSGCLSSFTNKKAFCIKAFYDNTTINGTVDLGETWVKVDGDIVWQPYAPTTE